MVLMYLCIIYILFTKVHRIDEISMNMVELCASSNFKPLHFAFKNCLQN